MSSPITVLDTCTLIWWTLDPEKLSDRASRACDIGDESRVLLISSISLWEIGIKLKNRKLDIGMPVETYHQLLKKISNLEIVSVDGDIWVKSLGLKWSHRDPVDRAIVALADLRNAPLVTADKAILKFYQQAIW